MKGSVNMLNKRIMIGAVSVITSFSLMAACGSDTDNDGVGNDGTVDLGSVDTVLDATVNSIDPAISSVDTIAPPASVDESNADEGTAMDSAMMVMASLQSMTDGGEPTVANFEAAAATLPAGVELTGLDDGDKDGRDDDAKATVEANGGEDKACVQQQDGVWEVTDDEC
jgi:hypothetical protein